MPKPTVTSVELSTGDVIPLSFDIETGTPIEILLHGSNLQGVTEIELDSGPEILWSVQGVSASPKSVYIVAYATGNPGEGYVAFNFRGHDLTEIEGAYFELPLLD